MIKVKFVDFWESFYTNNFFLTELEKYFNIQISDTPDFLIFSVFGNDHLNYNCIKIFYTAENVIPDYRFCDYSIGFNYSEHSRHLRYPLYLFYGDISKLIATDTHTLDSLRHRSKFCSFIVSNDGAKERIAFFQKLNEQLKVDSAGKVQNNMVNGWTVPKGEKYNFVQSYKFNIAFENESSPGYTTEKIFEPMMAGTIPIYWGDPLIMNDFNINSFVHIKDRTHWDNAIKLILTLNKNENLLLDLLNKPFLNNNKVPEHLKKDRLIEFFEKIFLSDKLRSFVSMTPSYKILKLQKKSLSTLAYLKTRTSKALKNVWD